MSLFPTSSQIELAAERLEPHIRKTPFVLSDHMGSYLSKELFFKCENLQITGSFKIRGAGNFILENIAVAKKTGVVAASAGNHAQGVAAMCKRLGISATIFMPTATPHIKIRNTQAWGAKVELVGSIYDESFDAAMVYSKQKRSLFVHPYRDPLVMAGQGTIALELLGLEDFKNVEALVIAVGGGGLAAGCATILKERRPDLKIYGVSGKSAPATWESFHGTTTVERDVHYTLAEGVAAKRADPEIVDHLKSRLDDYFAVGEESIAHAISLFIEHGKLVVEGAGALPLAAILEGSIPEKRVALLIAGGNIDPTSLSNVLQRGLVEQGRLVHLLITVSDRPGGLHALTHILSQMKANILQVFHQRFASHLSIGEADVELDIETRGKDHTQEIIKNLSAQGFRVRQIS